LKRRLSFSRDFLEFSTHSPICINPFSSIPIHDDEAASDALAMLKPILALMAAPKEGTTDLEDTYLEQAIQRAWESKKNATTITDVANFLLKHPDLVAMSLGERLAPLYRTRNLWPLL
jgi:conjugal transfer ATP-binding protein TraC